MRRMPVDPAPPDRARRARQRPAAPGRLGPVRPRRRLRPVLFGFVNFTKLSDIWVIQLYFPKNQLILVHPKGGF